ncbi:hypothetical protein ACFFMN_38250 [Planobispora siamensis]|uniref:Lipoprotein n=1 Tax=Planobispora siamensis TaxID=936338 RepID=A0A8J3SXH1_9ACTN|nr:hypothetical protein [Planobispora siamensis]GIH97333.1 hypothetical protein Psi01_79630 [Planobispora siamensis]
MTSRGLALVLALAAAGCSDSQPVAPVPTTAPASSAAPPSSVPAPTPVPATGPGSACEDPDLRAFLSEVARHSDAGGLDAGAPVSRWLTLLLDAAPAAVEPTLEHIQQGIAAAEAYTGARAGGAEAAAQARRLLTAAAGLAQVCGLADDYGIPAPGTASPTP